MLATWSWWGAIGAGGAAAGRGRFDRCCRSSCCCCGWFECESAATAQAAVVRSSLVEEVLVRTAPGSRASPPGRPTPRRQDGGPDGLTHPCPRTFVTFFDAQIIGKVFENTLKQTREGFWGAFSQLAPSNRSPRMQTAGEAGASRSLPFFFRRQLSQPPNFHDTGSRARQLHTQHPITPAL